MNTFLEFPIYLQVIILGITIPMFYFFLYFTVRVISRSALQSYLEYKIELFRKLFPDKTKNQDIIKKEGGSNNVS
jgi:hypothetical protein